MEARRLANLRRLHRAASGEQEALKQEVALYRAAVGQLREALERLRREREESPVGGPAAVLQHARRHAEWLAAEAERLSREIAACQERLGKLREAEVAAAQRSRSLERLIERLELDELRRLQRVEQEFVDHFARRSQTNAQKRQT